MSVQAEYRRLFSTLNEWKGSDMYNTLYRGLEARLGSILEQWVDTEDPDTALRLQGSAREVRNILKILTPKIYSGGNKDTTILR